MKVVQIHNYYQQPGGEDNVFTGEVALLRERGHEVHTYTDHNDRVSQINPLQVAATTFWSRRSYRALRKLFRRVGPDIAHFHNTLPLISPAGYYAARAERVAVVQTLHNYRLACPAATLLREGRVCEACVGRSVAWPAVVHRCYRGSRSASAVLAGMLAAHRLAGTWSRLVDRFIALTPFARDKLVSAGLPGEKVALTPNFLPDVPSPRAADELGEGALFVGRLSPEKGLKLLLSAWRERSLKVPLRIIGDGPLASEVAAEAERLPGVTWLGRRDDVLEHMRRSAFLVLPSMWYEGFPLVAVEAMAAGLPILASRLGSLGDVVEDGRTGLHFEPGNLHDLADKVEYLGSQGEPLRAMGQAARSVFEARYTAERHYHGLRAIYQQAIARRR